MDSLGQRIGKAFTAVIISITIGTIGFWLLSDHPVSFFDCFFMTIITLSTVGYGEVIELSQAGRIFASAMII